MACSVLVIHSVLGAIGVVLILLGGILGWVGFPIIVGNTVADTVAIKEGSDAWDRWEELPLPMQFRVYIFNVLNPDEINAGGKPEVEEVGPYIYTETRHKENISYFEEEDRATYYQKALFHFDAKASYPLTEDDIVTVPNVPMLSFAQITENIPALSSSITMFNTALEKMWTDNNVFTQAKVGDYLFGGLTMDCNPDLVLANVDQILMCASYALVHPPAVIIDDPEFGGKGTNSFSFFKYKNDTYDGLYEVRLGIDESKLIGQIINWEGSNHRNSWGGETCNKIQGTDSTIFRPNLEEEEAKSLYIYNTDICRSVRLDYLDDTSFRDIDGKRYVATNLMFGSVDEYPDNYCYCPRSVNNLTEYGGCLRQGILDLSSCQGAPVLLSFPHFLGADKMYTDMVTGLKPDEEKHRIFLDLEPYTGTPLRGASKVQMNVFLKPIEKVDIMSQFQGSILPVLWIDEGVELNDDLIQMLNDELFNVLNILDIVRWVLVGVGIAVTVCTAGSYLFLRQKRKGKGHA